MFEVCISSSSVLKKVIDVIKELFHNATFDFSDSGIQLEAMTDSCAYFVSLILRPDGFHKFRCDRNLSIGMNLTSMVNILECAHNDDTVTMKAQGNADTVTFMFESPNPPFKRFEFQMKTINLNRSAFSMQEIYYESTFYMPSWDFARICRDLSQFNEFMIIECFEEGVKFSGSDDIDAATIQLVQTSAAENKENAIIVEMEEPVKLTFACRHLNFFEICTPLSAQVQLSMSASGVLMAEYIIQDYGYFRFWLLSENGEGEADEQ